MCDYPIFDIETTINQLFMNILFNWDNIKILPDVISAVNMETNNMCKIFKEQNPTMRDSFIQAFALSFLIVMMHVVESNGTSSLETNQVMDY